MKKMIDRYNNLIRNVNKFTDKKVFSFIPTPTEKDYKKGYIVRYFLQKTNDKGSPIFEVNLREFKRILKTKLYTGVDIRWRISGPLKPEYDDKGNVINKAVSESNRISIRLVSHKIPNLKLYLPNLLQFYKN